jgi:hypothetical protein
MALRASAETIGIGAGAPAILQGGTGRMYVVYGRPDGAIGRIGRPARRT